ncbi:MAG: M20 family metallo-hydrolase [Candidatus Latescibacteria bacterium]|nr:M20 family metallo-hydrolase [Candidatus Latescibacterota bacterium]
MWRQREWQKISDVLDGMRDEMIKMQTEITAIPAIGPSSGGDGETERAKYLIGLLKELGLEISEYNAPDSRVTSGNRPNIIARFKGIYPTHKIWIMTHMDIVPPGPRDLWNTDPYQATVIDDKIYGRGTEDNQQDMVASIAAVKALKSVGFMPVYDVNLILVSDEETGSQYGAGHLLKVAPQLFKADDIYVIPDAGNEDGTLLEIAEKSIFWVKFTTKGKQVHAASAPKGINAHRANANLIVALDKMFKKNYKKKDRLFSPPFTTAEPTKKEANVPNVNTVPGEDVFYFDCRVIPEYDIQQVLADIKTEVANIEQKFGVQIKLDFPQAEQAAPPTSVNAPVVKLLKKAIKQVYNVNAKPRGIGGGTVAAFFRRLGFPAVVWAKFADNAHKPNEYCLIDNMKNDAKVYAYLAGMEVEAKEKPESRPAG